MSVAVPEPTGEEEEYYRQAKTTGVPVVKNTPDGWRVYTVVGKFYADDEEGANGLRDLFRRDNL